MISRFETLSTFRPLGAKALRTSPFVIFSAPSFWVTKAVIPESMIFSTPSIVLKAARALFAAPHPPPLKDTEYPAIVDAATSSASAGVAKAAGVNAPKAHMMPILIFAFISRLGYPRSLRAQDGFLAADDWRGWWWPKKKPCGIEVRQGVGKDALVGQGNTTVLVSVSFGGSRFSGSVLRLALKSPTDFVAFGGGPGFADGAVDGAFVSTAATHFLEDALAIKFGLQPLEGAVHALTTFDINASTVFLHKK